MKSILVEVRGCYYYYFVFVANDVNVHHVMIVGIYRSFHYDQVNDEELYCLNLNPIKLLLYLNLFDFDKKLDMMYDVYQ